MLITMKDKAYLKEHGKMLIKDAYKHKHERESLLISARKDAYMHKSYLSCL